MSQTDSEHYRDLGNESYKKYVGNPSSALFHLEQAVKNYQLAAEKAQNNDESSSAMWNLVVGHRALSQLHFKASQTSLGLESARHVFRLQEEALETGRTPKPLSWIQRLSATSVEYSTSLLTYDISMHLLRLCPTTSQMCSDTILRLSADNFFKQAVVRMDVRDAEAKKTYEEDEDGCVLISSDSDDEDDDDDDEESDDDVVEIYPNNKRSMPKQKQSKSQKKKKGESDARMTAKTELNDFGIEKFDRKTESILVEAQRLCSLADQSIQKECRICGDLPEMAASQTERKALVTELMDSIQIQKSICEIRRALNHAKQLKRQALEAEIEIDMNAVWLSIDAFKFTAFTARECDIETEAEAEAEMAALFQLPCSLPEYAKRYAKHALELALALQPRNVTTTSWYRLASRLVKDFQQSAVLKDLAQKQALREKYKEELKTEFEAMKKANEKSAVELLKHIYKVHPPKDASQKLDETKLGADELKKTLQKSIIHYHPDRNGTHGEKWSVLVTEICAFLTSKYDMLGCHSY